ncbi:hypothetical protein DPEC_G00163010 [Dallia pectoralis]|uniref:Uncharacterized protein n=1 Tax=Dallia pectoralis TaxID=75939 RepID=A0ACC2GH26_DALPE|nr:hypothetical protein DPEC_G00163010 [Dallia pectoralis]
MYHPRFVNRFVNNVLYRNEKRVRPLKCEQLVGCETADSSLFLDGVLADVPPPAPILTRLCFVTPPASPILHPQSCACQRSRQSPGPAPPGPSLRAPRDSTRRPRDNQGLKLSDQYSSDAAPRFVLFAEAEDVTVGHWSEPFVPNQVSCPYGPFICFLPVFKAEARSVRRRRWLIIVQRAHGM